MKKYTYVKNCLSGKLTILLLLLFVSTINAQTHKNDTTLNRTVVVEQEYNPDIMDASKINLLPNIEEPTIKKQKVEYDTSISPLVSFGSVNAMQPFTLKNLQPDAKKGYAHLGYGNKGNVDAKFNYLFDLSTKDRLNIFALLKGINTELMIPGDITNGNIEIPWNTRYYKSDAGVDYLHLFDKINMNISGRLGADVFNYHQIEPTSSVYSDKQNHTKGNIHLGIESTDETLPIQFQLETNYLYFNKKYNRPDSSSNKETLLRTKANVFAFISDQQCIGINAEMNNQLYTLPSYKNYTSLQLNPYYTFEKNTWKFRLGAHVDLTLGKESSINIAPDLEAQYLFAKSFLFYMKANGGTKINDFRQIESENPYWDPSVQANNSFNKLDGVIGLKASPIGNVWFDLFGGYKITDNNLCFINYNQLIDRLAYSNFIEEDTKSLYAGVQIKYQQKGLFSVSAKGTYYHWDADHNEALLAKPQFEFEANTEANISANLSCSLNYSYTSRKEVTLYYSDPSSLASINNLLFSYKMKPISNLSLGINYKLFNGISIFAKLNNLLNQKYQYYYSYPVEQINFIGGLSFQF